MEIQINRNIRLPINDQLKDQIKGLIHAGQLKTGDRLPTIRELSTLLSVNINTIALAYRDLTNEGVIITQRGVGTFVASTPNMEELQTIRHKRLASMVSSLLRETDRLGYHRDELRCEFNSQLGR
jgi:GntR family transcriptional regulator